jgi:oligoribonuclease NrnB/cAMP/cGMP phosphodiesterase (DHH superfamily)
MAHTEAVVAHADPDGVASASGLAIKCGIDSENIFFTDYHTDSLKIAVEGAMSVIEKGTSSLFLFDLTPKGTAEDPLSKLIRDAKSKDADVFWIDHHDCRSKEAMCLAVLCDLAVFGESRYCATELVGKHLGVDGVFYENLGKLIHCADFQVRPEGKWSIAGLDAAKVICAYGYSMEAISALPYEKKQEELKNVVKIFESGRFIDKHIYGMARDFRKVNAERMAVMLENLHIIPEGVIGFPPGPVEPSEACRRMLEETGAKIAFVVEPEGNVSMRRRDDSINLAIIAGWLDGGGHPYAAGFQVEKRPSGGVEAYESGIEEKINAAVEKTRPACGSARAAEAAVLRTDGL